VVGPDGATHAGSFDLSYLRCIPNMVVMAPSNEDECRQMLYTGFLHDGPAAVRYPRGGGNGTAPVAAMSAIPIGKAEVRRHGRRIALLAFGALVDTAIAVGEALDATVVSMRYIKPLDTALLAELAESHDLLVTLEDNAIAGGAGSGVAEFYASQNTMPPQVLHLGLADTYLEHASREELLAESGLDADGIRRAIAARWPELERNPLNLKLAR
jgi:1-deoxy-D-xylulose-5-phosphate synthase